MIELIYQVEDPLGLQPDEYTHEKGLNRVQEEDAYSGDPELDNEGGPFSMNADVPSPLLDPDEVAAYLNVDIRDLRDMRYRGDGPRYIKITHRRIRYRQADVDEWLDSHTRTQTEGVR